MIKRNIPVEFCLIILLTFTSSLSAEHAGRTLEPITSKLRHRIESEQLCKNEGHADKLTWSKEGDYLVEKNLNSDLKTRKIHWDTFLNAVEKLDEANLNRHKSALEKAMIEYKSYTIGWLLYKIERNEEKYNSQAKAIIENEKTIQSLQSEIIDFQKTIESASPALAQTLKNTISSKANEIAELKKENVRVASDNTKLLEEIEKQKKEHKETITAIDAGQRSCLLIKVTRKKIQYYEQLKALDKKTKQEVFELIANQPSIKSSDLSGPHLAYFKHLQYLLDQIYLPFEGVNPDRIAFKQMNSHVYAYQYNGSHGRMDPVQESKLNENEIVRFEGPRGKVSYSINKLGIVTYEDRNFRDKKELPLYTRPLCSEGFLLEQSK